MNCKLCGKELIGKEKFFCKSCWTKGADKVKKGVVAVGSVALAVAAVVAKVSKDNDD